MQYCEFDVNMNDPPIDGVEADGNHWPQNMDGGQRRKIEAKRPPYWSSQKAVVTLLLSMKVLWDIQEYDPNNAFLIKENMWKRTDVKYWCS